MAIDIFDYDLREVQQLRSAAAHAAAFPEDYSEGWQKSPIDPCALLCAFPSLRLRQGYTLRAYSFRAGGNGNAFVYSMPTGSPFPEPKECARDRGHFLEPPIPLDALADVMDAIEGDESPWSYVSASLLSRELREFGARWHGCEWGTHVILEANPINGPRPSADMTTDASQWEWIEPEPQEWRPVVVMSEPITVRFFTYTGLGAERIVRHLDSFRPGKYQFDVQDTPIAQGPGGFIF
jgi:hypothetical protein